MTSPAPDYAFPLIGEYGFLSDSETTALIAPGGEVEWLCVPRMDSESVFAAILDREAGSFRLCPPSLSVPIARRYVPGSLVLETTWMTATGFLVIRDALLVGPWGMEDEPAPPYRRLPRDDRAEHVLVRTATCCPRHGRGSTRLRAGTQVRAGAITMVAGGPRRGPRRRR